ncbi:hypothetical protein KIN20_013832, partial [Parelaphostrongylus tenuis]
MKRNRIPDQTCQRAIANLTAHNSPQQLNISPLWVNIPFKLPLNVVLSIIHLQLHFCKESHVKLASITGHYSDDSSRLHVDTSGTFLGIKISPSPGAGTTLSERESDESPIVIQSMTEE